MKKLFICTWTILTWHLYVLSLFSRTQVSSGLCLRGRQGPINLPMWMIRHQQPIEIALCSLSSMSWPLTFWGWDWGQEPRQLFFLDRRGASGRKLWRKLDFHRRTWPNYRASCRPWLWGTEILVFCKNHQQFRQNIPHYSPKPISPLPSQL